jgi:hypothetical protein
MTQTQNDYPQRVVVSNDEELRAVTELLNVLRGVERAGLLRTNWELTLKRQGPAVKSLVSLPGVALSVTG